MDKMGRLSKIEVEKLLRRREHFKSVLNRSDPYQLADIKLANIELDICSDPPSLEEVITAIKAMKSGNGPVVDGITTEMVKADVNVTSSILTEIFKQIWIEYKISFLSCLKREIVEIAISGWAFSIYSLTSKTFSKIVLTRLTASFEKDLRSQKAGFRPGRSCSDHIFTLRQILEQSNEWNTQLCINFIDLEKEFDIIHRESGRS
jgi:sorting nexin-29